MLYMFRRELSETVSRYNAETRFPDTSLRMQFSILAQIEILAKPDPDVVTCLNELFCKDSIRNRRFP